MKNLLPDFILENYKNNVLEGELNAFTMFADISGFTPMTGKLMKGGNEGAELLSNILSQIFTPTVKCVYDSGGFITNFAGDSFTSIIPFLDKTEHSNRQAMNALYCAGNILDEFKRLSTFKTRFGDIDLKVRIGISAGNVEWAIVGKEQKSFYFRGDTINACADALKLTRENEILMHDDFRIHLTNSRLPVSKRGDYYCLERFPKRPAEAVNNTIRNTSDLTKQIFTKHFLPEPILKAKESGEFRNVATVFISFDFSLSKETIDELFVTIIEAVKRYSGYLKDIEFGDKGGVIVCYFGAPLSFEEDAQRAVHFIGHLRKRMSDVEHLRNLKLKTGLTFGKVFTGFLGSEERVQYSVIGNEVNLCARLMSTAEWNQVLISEEAYNRIKSKNDFVFIGRQKFKGFRNNIPVYKFQDKHAASISTNVSSVISESKGIKLHSASMFGRNAEMLKLNEYVEDIFNSNTSGIIYLTGEAGIGKSRILGEFRRECPASAGLTWMYCYASEILNRPLSPFKYLLRNFYKQSDMNSPEENKCIFDSINEIIVKKLDILSIENKLQNAKILQVKNELLRTTSVLAAMLDIHWKGSLYEKLEPQLRSENTLFAICNLVMAECLSQPVVLEIEDIQWIDKESEEVLKMLLNNFKDLPLAIICTARSDQSRMKSLAEAAGKSFRIPLEYLNASDVEQIAKDILGSEIDNPTAEFIIGNTNGNPYFIEQFILDLNERNEFKKTKNYLTLTQSKGNTVPSTINGVLISRFDRLPERVKNIVRSASILGSEFDSRILKGMFPDDSELHHKIKAAEDENIWKSIGGEKYVFTHALLQKAVYELQLKSEVTKLHKFACASLSKIYGKKISFQKLEQLAFHFGLGNSIVDIRNNSILSGEMLNDKEYKSKVFEFLNLQNSIVEKYKSDFRNEKALQLYDQIFPLLSRLNEKELMIDTLIEKSKILNNLSAWNHASKEAERATKMAIEINDKFKEMSARILIAESLFYRNDFDKAINSYEKLLKYFEKSNRSDEVLYILDFYGKLFLSKGNYKKAFKLFGYQLSLSNKMKNKKQKALSLLNLGMLHRRQGEFPEAMKYFKECLKYFKETGNKPKIAMTLRHMGIFNFNKGDLRRALKFFHAAKKIFEELGDRNNYAIALGNIGNIHLCMQEFDKAREYFSEHLSINKQLNNILNLSISHLNMAMLYMESSNFSDALKVFLEQKQILKKHGKLDPLPMILSNLGLIYSYKGNLKKALESYSEQLTIDKKLNNKDGIIRALINIANLFEVKCDYKKAESYYKKCLAMSSKFRIEVHLHFILLNYSNMLFSAGKIKLSEFYCQKLLRYKFMFKKEYFLNEALFLNCKIQLTKCLMHKGIERNHKVSIIRMYHKLESILHRLKDKETIAQGHCDLYIFAKKLSERNISAPQINFHKEKAINLYNELKKFISPLEYRNKMKILSDSKY